MFVGSSQPQISVVPHELGRMLQVRIPPGYVGLDMVAHNVLVHPHLRITQDLVAPHEDVVDEGGCRECEVGSIVVRIHARQPEGEGVREQCPVVAKQPLLATNNGD